jgi:hypothetical protein
MYRHGPTCLAGPVSKARVMWVWSDSGAGVTETVTFEPPDAADPLASRADIRLDLVRRVRQEIADGVYDTSDKLDVALDRLLDRLEQGE